MLSGWAGGLVLALAGYVAVRAAGLVTLALWARERHGNVLRLLAARSDAGWYLGIARDGYDLGAGQSNLAFFPLFPGLTAAAAHVTGWARYPGLAVAWTAALAAAAGIYAVGSLVHGRRAGIIAAVLWGLLPHAVVETMAYSEGLFTALAAWSLYALLRQRWLTAGLLCAVAGTARPTAAALIPVVVLDGVLAAVRERGAARWRAVAGALAAPAGMAAWLAWVAVRTGRLDGWQRIQRTGWGSAWDWGQDTARRAGEVLTTPHDLEFFAVTAIVLASVLLAVLGVAARSPRQPWQTLAYAVLLLGITLGTGGYYHSKARFLLPAFPLLLVLARPLARAARAERLAILVTLTAVSAWFGGYLLLVWRWSP